MTTPGFFAHLFPVPLPLCSVMSWEHLFWSPGDAHAPPSRLDSACSIGLLTVCPSTACTQLVLVASVVFHPVSLL